MLKISIAPVFSSQSDSNRKVQWQVLSLEALKSHVLTTN